MKKSITKGEVGKSRRDITREEAAKVIGSMKDGKERIDKIPNVWKCGGKGIEGASVDSVLQDVERGELSRE